MICIVGAIGFAIVSLEVLYIAGLLDCLCPAEPEPLPPRKRKRKKKNKKSAKSKKTSGSKEDKENEPEQTDLEDTPESTGITSGEGNSSDPVPIPLTSYPPPVSVPEYQAAPPEYQQQISYVMPQPQVQNFQPNAVGPGGYSLPAGNQSPVLPQSPVGYSQGPPAQYPVQQQQVIPMQQQQTPQYPVQQQQVMPMQQQQVMQQQQNPQYYQQGPAPGIGQYNQQNTAGQPPHNPYNS